MRFIIIILFLSSISPLWGQDLLSKEKKVEYSSESELLPYEVHLKSLLKEIVTMFSQSKDIKIAVINSALAIEFQVLYPPQDQAELNMLSGLRIRTIRQLFNELSIVAQQSLSREKNRKFDYYKRKVLLVTFHNR